MTTHIFHSTRRDKLASHPISTQKLFTTKY